MLRKFLRLIQEIDYFFSKLVYAVFPKQYPRSGTCHKTGVCCRNIGVVAPRWVFASPLATRWVIGWYQYVNEFFFKALYADEQVFVFGCPYLKDNLCSRHAHRPPICRAYPQAGFFTRTATFATCGFHFLKR